MVAIRATAAFAACFLLVHFATKPIEFAINYLVLGWGAKYPAAIPIYAAASLCVFILAGLLLVSGGGIRSKQIMTAAVFGVVCMLALAIRNPFLSLSPKSPSIAELALAYRYIVVAPFGAIVGGLLASKFSRSRLTPPPYKSLERTREG